MLDDCKGDKFEEVLLLFSATVLRKQLLSSRRNQPSSVAMRLAQSKNIDKRQLSTVNTISLAYRASLARTLQSRATLDLTLNNFRTVLYEKTNDYHQRHLVLFESQDETSRAFSPQSEDLIRRELRQNWVGSIEGCDALLAGAKVASADAHMDSSFDGLWYHFRQGTTPQVPPERISLLDSLQSRVVEQNDRLRLWKTYKDVFEESNKPVNPSQASPATLALEITAETHGLDIFNQHRNIRVEQTSPVFVSPSLGPVVDYEQVVQNMKQALSEVRKRKQKQQGGANHAAPRVDNTRRTNTMPRQAPIPVFFGGSKDPKEDLFSPLKRPLLESTNSTPVTSRNVPHQTYQWLSRNHSQPVTTTPQSVRSGYDVELGSRINLPYGSDLSPRGSTELSPSLQRDGERHVKAPRPISTNGREVSPKLEAVASYTTHYDSVQSRQEYSIDDPLASLEHKIGEMGVEDRERLSPPLDLPGHLPPTYSSPPAPIYRQYSPQEQPDLTERARMSMTSFRSSENSQPLPQPTPDASQSIESVEISIADSRRTSLAERALMSMNQASLNPQPQRRTTTKERPRSSFFPSTAAQFSTPIKSGRNSLGGTLDTTPRDKLFEQDVEYASVFKSRPKIAMSPVLSPQLDLQMEEAEDFSFEGDADGTESMLKLHSSPLGKFM